MQMHWSDGNLHALEKHLQSLETPEPTAEHKRDAYIKVIEEHLTDTSRLHWVSESSCRQLLRRFGDLVGEHFGHVVPHSAADLPAQFGVIAVAVFHRR